MIVVGAGPVGLTCAALLNRAGVPVVVLEADAERGRDLRASTWHPPTLDLIDSLGLAAPLIERGLVSPTWQVRLHPSGERERTTRVMALTMRRWPDDRPGNRFWWEQYEGAQPV